jgi:hypothetical protein
LQTATSSGSPDGEPLSDAGLQKEMSLVSKGDGERRLIILLSGQALFVTKVLLGK